MVAMRDELVKVLGRNVLLNPYAICDKSGAAVTFCQHNMPFKHILCEITDRDVPAGTYYCCLHERDEQLPPPGAIDIYGA